MTATAQLPAARERPARVRARRYAQYARNAAAVARAKAVAWRVHAAAPGLAGICLISAGLGLRWGLWLGLVSLGGFLLRIDSRIS